MTCPFRVGDQVRMVTPCWGFESLRGGIFTVMKIVDSQPRAGDMNRYWLYFNEITGGFWSWRFEAVYVSDFQRSVCDWIRQELPNV